MKKLVCLLAAWICWNSPAASQTLQPGFDKAEYEELLKDQDFFRVHNSFLINLNLIKNYVRGEGGYVVMANGKSIDVSKRKKESFLSRLGH